MDTKRARVIEDNDSEEELLPDTPAAVVSPSLSQQDSKTILKIEEKFEKKKKKNENFLEKNEMDSKYMGNDDELGMTSNAVIGIAEEEEELGMNSISELNSKFEKKIEKKIEKNEKFVEKNETMENEDESGTDSSVVVVKADVGMDLYVELNSNIKKSLENEEMELESSNATNDISHSKHARMEIHATKADTLLDSKESKIIESHTNAKQRAFPTMQSFIEYEIWSKKEQSRRFEKTGDFAKFAVELNLCETVKIASKAIRDVLSDPFTSFSSQNVVERFLQTIHGDVLQSQHDIDEEKLNDLISKCENEFMFQRGEIREMLIKALTKLGKMVAMATVFPGKGNDDDDGNSSTDSSSASNNSDDEDDTAEHAKATQQPSWTPDSVTAGVFQRLTNLEMLKSAAIVAGLDRSRGIKGLSYETVSEGFKILREMNRVSKSTSLSSKTMRSTLGLLEKKLRASIPLTIRGDIAGSSQAMIKATDALINLAPIAVAARCKLIQGVRFEKAQEEDEAAATGTMFRLDHPLAKARFRGFSWLPQRRVGFVSTTLAGAAYVLDRGHPMPMENIGEIVIKGRPDLNAKVVITCVVCFHENHCEMTYGPVEVGGGGSSFDYPSLEFPAAQDVASPTNPMVWLKTNENLRVFDGGAIVPVLFQFV